MLVIKKIWIIVAILIALNINTFAQENSNDLEVEARTFPYGFYFGPKFVVSQVDEQGCYSPFEASFALGFEYGYRVAKYFEIQPSFELSFLHHLWTGKMVALSEIENRTAFTFAFTAELPFMLAFDVQRWTLSFGASLALLIRFSALDLGVKGDEIGRNRITAKEEVSKINSYFWQEGRWFYPAIRAKCEYTFESGWKAGLLFSAYLPISNIWASPKAETSSGKIPFFHDSIFNLAIIIHPGKKY
ncbi:MAG: hypothetical protein ACTTJ3_00580 [Treponema sp.]